MGTSASCIGALSSRVRLVVPHAACHWMSMSRLCLVILIEVCSSPARLFVCRGGGMPTQSGICHGSIVSRPDLMNKPRDLVSS